MVWTSFWTDLARFVGKNYGIHHNPIFIESPKIEAIKYFRECYGNDVIEEGRYCIFEYHSLEEASAYYRGCVIKERGFLEESRGDDKCWYTPLSSYIKQPFVLVIEKDDAVRVDGQQCFRCKEFFLWAEPNQATGTFLCRSCKFNPYR